MKTGQLALSLLCLVLMHSTVSAQPEATSAWHWGLHTGWQKYQEPAMQLQGPELGIQGYWRASDSLKIEGRLTMARLDYNSPVSGRMSNIGQREASLIFLGPSWSMGSASIEPGLQWGITQNDLRGRTSLGAMGYERDQDATWAMLRWTQLLAHNESAWRQVSLDVKGLLQGRQRSHLSQAAANHQDVTNQQTQGWGWALRGKIQLWNQDLEPYLQWQRIETSDTVFDGVSYVKEPANKKLWIGLSWWPR